MKYCAPAAIQSWNQLFVVGRFMQAIKNKPFESNFLIVFHLGIGHASPSFGRKFMRLAAFVLAVISLSLCNLLRAEETVTVGGAVVKIPEGWKQSEKDDTLVLTPPELPAGVACSLTLLGGEPYNGTVTDQLAAEWKGFQALGTLASDSGDSIIGAGSLVEIGARSARIDVSAEKSIFVLLYVVKSNQRVDKMVFVSSDFEAFQKYSVVVSEVMAATKYVAPKALEPLSGVCFGFSQVKTDTRPECWFFLPAGVVYRGFPTGGPATLDLEYQRIRRVGAFGVYRIVGDEVVATFEKVKEPTRFSKGKDFWTAPVTRDFQDRSSGRHGNTIAAWTDEVPTTLRITHVDPCDGLKLSASFRLDKPVGPIPSIKFTSDGDFSEDGLIHEVIPMTVKEGGGRVGSGLPANGGNGKYTIEKNTLNLTYSDGKKISMTFLITNTQIGRSRPRELFLQGSKLLLAP